MNNLEKNNLGLIISIILSIIVITGIIYLTFFNVQEKPQYTFDYNKLHYSSENIEIFILPNQNAITKVIDTINLAENEIHCTFRALNYEELENALIEKEKTTKVRAFINADYKGNKRIYHPFVRFEDRLDENSGMMHNNYCIIDGKIVITGSLIFNGNTVGQNIHDVLIIKSEELAKEYNSDFWRIYNNQENQVNEIEKKIQINKDTLISANFCPIDNCEEIVSNEINNAKNKIGAAVYLLTNEKYIEILKNKNIERKIILEPYGITRNSLIYENLPGVKMSHTRNKMHTKLITIDDETTITGTMNPTYYGAYLNQENFLIIKNKEINKFYNDLIDYLYSQTK
jgi:phosphatidylserine/phosphatidylglycerophosphate/cardiolipin synthase-like enzyme